MADWGKIFADARLQSLNPNPELLAALPALKKTGFPHRRGPSGPVSRVRGAAL
jgi:hypothetical protein